jgi:low temperature requirement protein LtrA
MPLVRPPSLRTSQARSASQLELFFDLAYVLAVAELASLLMARADWGGAGRFAALFAVVFLSWVSFTLYANRFDTDDIIFRLAKFAGMGAILGCAASMSAATESKATVFAASYLAGRLVLVGLYWRAWRHVTDARTTIGVYLIAMSAVAALWAVSLTVPTGVALWLWGAAAALDVAAPFVASRRHDRAPLHLEHLPERFGLLVILVLGEVIAAIVTGVHDAAWAPESVLLAGAAFVTAAATWWVYFDVSGAVSSRALQRAQEESKADDENDDEDVDERHDLFVLGHLPLTAGIVAAGAGVEHLVMHPSTPLPSAGSWLLVGGLATFTTGAALVQGGSQQRPAQALLWPASAGLALLLVGWVGPASALPFTATVALVLTAAAAVGTFLARTTHT